MDKDNKHYDEYIKSYGLAYNHFFYKSNFLQSIYTPTDKLKPEIVKIAAIYSNGNDEIQVAICDALNGFLLYEFWDDYHRQRLDRKRR